MSQSLYTSMGGIAAATTSLSVISNNVANINTTAYKSSSVQFSDVYSTTLSYGSVATSTSGGTNPKQVGVGTQVGAISKNFNTGSWNSTGKNTDLMINGQGFFSVQAADGTTYYTRAGNFNIDENGNLVTSDGYKVLGTNTNLSTHTSSTTVKIPTAITANVAGTDLATASTTKKVLALNSTKSPITNGKFQLAVNGSSPVNITVDADGTVANMVTKINTQLAANPSPINHITLTANADGTLSFQSSDVTDKMTLTTPTTNASNFLTQTGLSTAKEGTLPTITTTVSAANAAVAETTAKTLIVGDSTAGTATTVNLSGPYTNLDTMINNINSQLSVAGSTVRAVNDNGAVKFSSPSGDIVTLAGTSQMAAGATTIATPTITSTTSAATNALKEGQSTTTTSAAATSALTEGAKTLIVNGTTISLTGAYADVDAMVAAISSQLTTASSTVTVANVGGTVKFTETAASGGVTFDPTGTSGLSSGATAGSTLVVGDATAGTSTTINLTGTPYADADSMVTYINSKLTASGSTIRATNYGGKVQFASSNGDIVSLAGTTGLATGTTAGSIGGPLATGKYTSNVLDQSVHITDLTSKSTSANSETIGTDGSIQVTYKDGSTLSVEPQKDGTYSFVYTTATDSIKITGEDCQVDTSVATPANFVIQMATVTNTEGLLAEGNNLYAAGPNTGDIVYTVAGDMGCGKVAAGGLESSNVDLAGELSNMILAQRAITANSRVFTTTSNIMDTINQMGR